MRSSSCRALVTRKAPVAPSGWPRAMAPPLGLVRSRSAPTSRCQASTTEAKASLISKTSMSPMAHAGALEQPLGGVDGARQHEHRIDAHQAGVDDPGPGREAERGRLLGGHHQHGRGAVADLRRVAGGVHAVGPGDRLEVAERLERGLAQALVARARGGWCRWACPRRRRRGRRSGTTWVSKRPSAQAVAARCCEARPNASVSARVTPHLSAMRSAPSNCDVNSYCPK